MDVNRRPNNPISRRDFLKVGATALAGTLLPGACTKFGVTPPNKEVESESPVIICHDPTQEEYPNAIMFIVFNKKNGDVSYSSQTFEGSSAFTSKADGSLTPFETDTKKFANTGLENFSLVLTEKTRISLSGCLVEEKDLPLLQNFFRLIPPEQEFYKQG